MSKKRKLKQGQTYWKSVIYAPDTVCGYPDQYVAIIYRCFITKVHGTTVYYQTERGHYISGDLWFISNTLPTMRQAISKAKVQLHEIYQMYEIRKERD